MLPTRMLRLEVLAFVLTLVATPPLASFFGFRSVEFDILFLVLLVLHVCYLSFVGLFDCVLLATPNSN